MSETRDAVRAKILGTSHKPKSRTVPFFGTEIELRQPTLGEVLAQQNTEDRKSVLIQLLISRAYIPGTDTRVFDDADADGLATLPFGQDFIRVNQALEALSEVNFLDKSPASDVTQVN